MSETAPSVRQQQIEERKKRLAAAQPQRARVRVMPASDDVRKYIRHPSGIKFPKDGAVEWPHDSFTKRRLRDGTVKRENEA